MKQTRTTRTTTRTTAPRPARPKTLTVYRVDCWTHDGTTRDCRIWCLTSHEARRLQLAHERQAPHHDATICTTVITLTPRGLLDALNLYAR